jgi:diguanylate cyclase (GGDEF)-like protein
MATHDALTGLANRTLFRERLDAGLAASRAGESGVAVLILDLNKFKLVNDTLGHPVGDALLKAVATRLCACVRGEDMVARLGGDEFAVVVRTADPVKEAAAIAKRIQTSLTSNFDVMGCDLRIGTSIGIATCKGSVGAEELIRQADAAQYRAKGESGDCYRFFDAALDRVVPLRRVS